MNSIELKHLNKSFNIDQKGGNFVTTFSKLFTNPKKIKVLDNINLTIKEKEFIGIIGKNGSGKSTLLKIILGVINADKGSVVNTNGVVLRLALGIGFDPNLTARDNIYVNGSILGLSFKKIGDLFNEIISFSEIEGFIDTPLKFFSSGMKTRLSFSIAMHAEADIYLIDEFFGDVGDEIFKEKTQKAIENNLLSQKTVLYVSHSLDSIRRNCDRVIVLNKGKINVFNKTEKAIAFYKTL